MFLHSPHIRQVYLYDQYIVLFLYQAQVREESGEEGWRRRVEKKGTPTSMTGQKHLSHISLLRLFPAYFMGVAGYHFSQSYDMAGIGEIARIAAWIAQ